MEADVSYLPEYVQPFQVHKPLYGVAVGKVIASKSSRWKEGDTVHGTFDWAEYVVKDEESLEGLSEGSTPEHSLSLCGVPGLTAYFGLLQVGNPKEGTICSFDSLRPKATRC